MAGSWSSLSPRSDAICDRLPGELGGKRWPASARTIETEMRFGEFSFGSIEVDGTKYEHDLVIDRGHVRKRRKGPSKGLQSRYGHTPLSVAEDIPWGCTSLVVGSGAAGSLPVMDEVAEEARRRGVRLVVMPTSEAIQMLERSPIATNAILHITC